MLCMKASGKNYIIIFAHSHIDASSCSSLGSLISFFKKLTDSSFCCPAIALLWLTKLIPCQISNSANCRWWLSILPPAPCQQGYQDRAECQPVRLVRTGPCSREWHWVTWQTRGSYAMSHPAAWQETVWCFHQRWPGGGRVPNPHLPCVGTASGGTKKKKKWLSHDIWQRRNTGKFTCGLSVKQGNIHTTILMTLYFHLHFCFRKLVL